MRPWSSCRGCPPLAAICTPVVLGHAASGGNGVFSTVPLQKRTVDHYRGRVFSTEWLLVMTAESISTFVGSGLLELDWLTREKAVLAFGLLQVASGLAWLFVVVPREQHAQAQEAALTNEPPAAIRSVDSSR